MIWRDNLDEKRRPEQIMVAQNPGATQAPCDGAMSSNQLGHALLVIARLECICLLVGVLLPELCSAASVGQGQL
jgi:hypothetical protein